MTVSNVVFDIGAVLVDWDPLLAWTDEFGSKADIQTFLERVDFKAKNARADAGTPFADLAREIDDPDDRALFERYLPRFARTVPNAVEGSWALLARLKSQGTPIHAITNWSAETWAAGVSVHPRLGDAFETLVVSGREKIAKPDPRIFQIFCERAGLAPDTCVFIDDAPHNVAAAQSVGMDAIHFTAPDALEISLKDRGLL